MAKVTPFAQAPFAQAPFAQARFAQAPFAQVLAAPEAPMALIVPVTRAE